MSEVDKEHNELAEAYNRAVVALAGAAADKANALKELELAKAEVNRTQAKYEAAFAEINRAHIQFVHYREERAVTNFQKKGTR